jgi:hypothetical protein
MDEQTYLIELKVLHDSVPGPVRLKRLLKLALRSFGLRCLNAQELPSTCPTKARREFKPKSPEGTAGLSDKNPTVIR